MKQHSESQERRVYPRAQLHHPLSAHCTTPGVSAAITELSEQGAVLRGTRKLAANSVIEMRLFLADRRGDAHTVSVRGRVIRSTIKETAVSFSPTLPVHMLRLRDYIHRQKK